MDFQSRFKSKLRNFVLTGGGDFGLALQHLEAAVKLATLHEEKGQWPQFEVNNCRLWLSPLCPQSVTLSLFFQELVPSLHLTFLSKPVVPRVRFDSFLQNQIFKLLKHRQFHFAVMSFFFKSLTSSSCSRRSTSSWRMWEPSHSNRNLHQRLGWQSSKWNEDKHWQCVFKSCLKISKQISTEKYSLYVKENSVSVVQYTCIMELALCLQLLR